MQNDLIKIKIHKRFGKYAGQNELKHEMFLNPNDRVYLEINTKEQDYTCCYNSREWREALDNDKNNIVIATTLFYARNAYLESQRRKAQQCQN